MESCVVEKGETKNKNYWDSDTEKQFLQLLKLDPETDEFVEQYMVIRESLLQMYRLIFLSLQDYLPNLSKDEAVIDAETYVYQILRRKSFKQNNGSKAYSYITRCVFNFYKSAGSKRMKEIHRHTNNQDLTDSEIDNVFHKKLEDSTSLDVLDNQKFSYIVDRTRKHLQSAFVSDRRTKLSLKILEYIYFESTNTNEKTLRMELKKVLADEFQGLKTLEVTAVLNIIKEQYQIHAEEYYKAIL